MRRAPAFFIGLLLSNAAYASTLNRPLDPVVLTGTSLPGLCGMPVDRIVALRYESGWTQIPVQIDERKVVEYRVVYNNLVTTWTLTTLAYTDPTTYTGPDTDPLFDADDELVLMARDAGDRAPVGAVRPPGTIGVGVEIAMTDPRDGGLGYAYLFAGDGSLAPDAGADYVTYTFNLLAGEYTVA